MLNPKSKITTPKPNYLHLFADDLGYGELGSYGQTKIETPNIDKLAREGMSFSQHYVMPVCAPSRYCLMTGIHSGKAFIRGNNEWDERGDAVFKAMKQTLHWRVSSRFLIPPLRLPKMLRSPGCETALVGGVGNFTTIHRPSK